ncbi:MAG: hypothetical protein L0H10_05960 [Comamonas sp.]|uniref:hypothetical protein n=1 Tax=Comamonas sp. TaxID=34028 RepID=UPI0026471A82|nr:hypothetical protein [Comamonas sp.]MDN5503351.1 hypothetical protein [Comamonas sp.]MDN5536849.1 hypothetical protein [Comamonas sp.]
MSVEVCFDEESAVASIPLADWPLPLVERLGRYFNIRDGELRLDYSHVHERHSNSCLRLFDNLTDRENFVLKFNTAALEGPISLTLRILGHDGAEVAHSSSILDREAYLDARIDLYEDVFKHTSQGLRESVMAEIKPDTILASWLFEQDSSRRARLLDDQEIMAALVANTSEANCIHGLQLVKARCGENNWAFEQLIQKHWLHVHEYVGSQLCNSASYVHDIVFTLFENSETIQASRDACLKVVDHAHPMIFPRLIRHCRSLVASDVRRLLLRAKTEKKDDFKDCVTAAFSMFASLLGDAMPSDLALAGAWHGFEPALLSQRGVAASLRELPTGSWDREVLWNQLGPAAREAWRQDLFDQVKEESELSQGLTHFACLWLGQAAFAEVEPVLLRLMDDEDQLTFANRLAATGPRQVLLRAKGLVRFKQGALDLYGSTDQGADVTTLPSAAVQTWLGNSCVEGIIHREISRIEGEFCHEYPATWGEDEEAHTARLLALTQRAMVEVNHRLQQPSATNRGQYPSLSVNVRQPSKREEGACTSTGAPLAADVLFLTRIVDKGKTVIQRATLIQVKKRRSTESGKKFGSTIGVDLQQCEDMLKQSEHAYYLILTPATSLPRLWVAPARLVRNLTQLHTSKASIDAKQVKDASCSYADFFLRNLVGLWAGDEHKEIVGIASGDPRLGRMPRHIVDIEVHRRSEASAHD